MDTTVKYATVTAVVSAVALTVAYKLGVRDGKNRVIRIVQKNLITVMSEELKEKSPAN